MFSLILEATTLLGQIQNRLIDHLDFILHHLFLLICAYYIIMLSTIPWMKPHVVVSPDFVMRMRSCTNFRGGNYSFLNLRRVKCLCTRPKGCRPARLLSTVPCRDEASSSVPGYLSRCSHSSNRQCTHWSTA